MHEKIYTLRVILVAVRASLAYLAWLVLVISAPVFFYAGQLTTVEKIAALFICYLSVWCVYFVLCLGFHYKGLKDPLKRENYFSLSETERGKQLGTLCEGW